MAARKPILPKTDRAILAQHEAGMHDRKPKPETCRECANDAIESAVPPKPIEGLKPAKTPARRFRATTAEPVADIVTDTAIIDIKTKADRKPRAGDARRAMDARRIAAKAKPVEPGTDIPTFLATVEALPPNGKVKAPKAEPKTKAPVVIAKPPEASILGAIEVPADGFRTREEWMLAAVEAFRPWFRDEGETLPPVRISIGWPGGRGPKTGVLGQCYAASAVEDAVPAIFVTPSQKDPVEVLETILHECIHAAGHMHHRQPFQKVARKFGFVNGGKIKTSAKESPDLYATLGEMAAALGAFPHSAVSGGNGADPKAPPVQSTRMLKVWCESDGYTLRATAKWLKVAVPACPVCEDVMTVDWRDK